ncbi:MAG: hypothetical protein AAGG46_10095, partial [Planctomycetota bacterium]
MTPKHRSTIVVAVWALAVTLLAGCGGREQLNDQYGRRTGSAAGSINGTSVFGEMLEEAGHRVRSWRYLSPSLEDADVIVWFPQRDTFGPTGKVFTGAPSPEGGAWLNDWLQYNETERTLVYVGRDWQAEREYWSNARQLAPAAQQPEFRQELRKAQTSEASRLSAKPPAAETWASECDWFHLERGNPKTVAKQLTGELFDGGNPFAEKTIDPKKANLEHWSSLHPNLQAETLLADGQGHPIVSEMRFDSSWTNKPSRLILVENGCFLLNGALVNPERRKLAGRLIARLGPPEQRVVFLETGPAPTIRDTDPNPRPPTGLELFAVWPIGAVLAQIAALGVVYA